MNAFYNNIVPCLDKKPISSISECFFLCLCVCSGITCCWADFRLRQQDLGDHRTRRPHRRAGRPASPNLQNLNTLQSTERRVLNITTVLSHCNYAPPLHAPPAQSTYTLLGTQTHIPLPVCMYVCLAYTLA